MFLQKWDYLSQKYLPMFVPDDYKIIYYTSDMNAITTCPYCGIKLKYGETYTSLEIHDDLGVGYHVCPKCYKEEWERRRAYKTLN